MGEKLSFQDAGWRLRQARRHLDDATQGEFGKMLGGFTVAQISQAERGRNLPSPEMLVALAEYGFNLNWLLLGEGPMIEPAAIEGRIPQEGRRGPVGLGAGGPGVRRLRG